MNVCTMTLYARRGPDYLLVCWGAPRSAEHHEIVEGDGTAVAARFVSRGWKLVATRRHTWEEWEPRTAT